MSTEVPNKPLINWRWPLYTSLVTLLVLLPLMIFGSVDGSVFGGLLIVALTSVMAAGWLLAALIHRRFRLCLTILTMFVFFAGTTWALWKGKGVLRPHLRWIFQSRRYKSQLLAEANSANGELRHVEWEGWGFPGAGNSVVYLVFDPADSLSTAAKSQAVGKFPGIPCEVPLVRRMEKQWYIVYFYTEQEWGRCQ